MTTLLERRAPTQTDWKTHLSEAGHEELAQMVSLLKDTTEFFSLFIIQSDFDTETREALVRELADELAPLTSIEIELTSDNYDLPFLLHEANRQKEGAKFFCVTGLEETPGLVLAAGEQPRRPPALAMLNHGREAIRTIDHPVIVWCDPLAYAALREHAPDFFDHYTALFTFIDAAPSELAPLGQLFDSSLMPDGAPRMLSAISLRPISPASKQFYEEQVARFTHPTIDRVRALLGLSYSLLGLSDSLALRHKAKILETLVEALKLSEDLELKSETARINALLLTLLSRERREDGLELPERNEEMLRLIRQSLEIFNEEQFPLEWAASKWCMGNELSQHSLSEAEKRQAVQYFQDAIRVWKGQKFDYYWASAEEQIGHVYMNLAKSKGNLKRAMSHFESAIQGYNEKEWPHQWASVQAVLGQAHLEMAQQEQKDDSARARLIRKAIANYKAATRGFTQARLPETVALTLASEGTLWRVLPTGNKREHLRNSAQCFEKSAQLLAEVGDVPRSALFSETAGEIHIELLKLTREPNQIKQAIESYENAAQAFEKFNNAEGIARNLESARYFREALKDFMSR